MSAKAVQRHVWDFAGLESFSVVVHVQFACLVGGSLVAAVKVCQNFAVGVVEKSLRCEQSDVAPKVRAVRLGKHRLAGLVALHGTARRTGRERVR
jgi:hypothetical protein